MADAGLEVDALDFSPVMLAAARAKGAARSGVRFTEADASHPPFEQGAYDAVLARHVLWALPDPADALARWLRLLGPGGTLVLVEWHWSTGAGLRADQTVALVEGTGREARLTRLDDPALWGRTIEDDRYLVVSPSPALS